MSARPEIEIGHGSLVHPAAAMSGITKDTNAQDPREACRDSGFIVRS
jgi:hypothetical protein